MALSWNDLSDREKQDLVRQYNSDRHSIDFDRYNATQEGLWSQIRRYRYALTNSPATYTPSIYPQDIINPPEVGDWERWLTGLKQKKRHAIVCHPSDLHFPYHDLQAEQLAYKIIDHVQPDIVVVGSDAIDFPHLSTFKHDPDVVHDLDVLNEFERLWNPHIHALNGIAPNAPFVYIFGNHETRFLKDIKNDSKHYRSTLLNRYVEIVRCGGRVKFIGQVDRVEIGNVFIEHGNRIGEYVAKALLNDMAFQSSVTFGHNHKITYYEKRGSRFTAKAAGGGCLCSLDPHYIIASRIRGPWQHSTVVSTIDLHNNLNNFDNPEFMPDTDGQLMARLGLTTIK